MSVPSKFTAAVVPEPGVQHDRSQRSLPPLEPGEVAIKITATAINPVDWKMRDYKIFLKDYPAILGSDAAGEIADFASDVSGFAKGDRVFFQGIIGNYDSSTFQQYCKMPAHLVAKTPKNISDDEAAGILLATMAALTGFYDSTGYGLAPPPWEQGGDKAGAGKAVVVVGGSSSVGQYAIQLARLSGFSKIITNASAQHHERLRSLGATTVLDRTTKSSPEDFAQAIGDTPLAFVFDAISETPTYLTAIGLLRATQKVETALIVSVSPGELEEDVGKAIGEEPKVEIKQILGIGSEPRLRHIAEPAAKFLGGDQGVIARGKFVPNAVTVIPGGLKAVEEALKKNKQGVSGTKVVLRPFDE